jgi:hypothetical protein
VPVAVLDAKADRGSVDAAIDEFQTETEPTSVDQINVTKIGPNRMVITVLYTG